MSSYIDRFRTDSIESLVLLDQPTVCAGVPWQWAEDGAEAGMTVDGRLQWVRRPSQSSPASRTDPLRRSSTYTSQVRNLQCSARDIMFAAHGLKRRCASTPSKRESSTSAAVMRAVDMTTTTTWRPPAS